jgi:hypothetical protein
MSARTIIGLLTRRATYLLRMVDLSSMPCVSSRSDEEAPTLRYIAVCAPRSVVVQHTLGHPLTRFNGHAHN